jgi:hypothetical protein
MLERLSSRDDNSTREHTHAREGRRGVGWQQYRIQRIVQNAERVQSEEEGDMVTAVRNAVILSQRPEHYGIRIEYSFKCESCAEVDSQPRTQIISSPKETRLGSATCRKCKAIGNPTFYKS